VGVLGVTTSHRTTDPAAPRTFYLQLTGGEPLRGAHDPIRIGHTLLVFFASEREFSDADPDGRRLEFSCDDQAVYWS
jgi:hypothetical protein